jgi:hypothetical protein
MDSPALLVVVVPVAYAVYHVFVVPAVYAVCAVPAVYVGRPQVPLGVPGGGSLEVDRPRSSLGVARHTVYAVPSPLHPVLSYPTILFHPLHFQVVAMVARRPVFPGAAILVPPGTGVAAVPSATSPVLPGVSSQVSHGAGALAKGP